MNLQEIAALQVDCSFVIGRFSAVKDTYLMKIVLLSHLEDWIC